LLVDLVGVDHLTNALGILLLFRGVACFVGPLIAGYLFDVTHDYGLTFAFLGGCLIAGGFMLPLTGFAPGRYVEIVDQKEECFGDI